MEAGGGRPGAGALLLPAVAGVALLVSMFALSWFGPSETVERGFEEAREIQEQFGGPEIVTLDLSETAWEGMGEIETGAIDIPIALALIAAGLCGVALTLVRMTPDPPVSRFAMAGATTALGTLATALVLYFVVNPPGDLSREIGVFAGLVAAGGVAVGGWIALEDEESSRPPSAPRASGRSGRRTRSRSSSG